MSERDSNATLQSERESRSPAAIIFIEPSNQFNRVSYVTHTVYVQHVYIFHEHCTLTYR